MVGGDFFVGLCGLFQCVFFVQCDDVVQLWIEVFQVIEVDFGEVGGGEFVCVDLFVELGDGGEGDVFVFCWQWCGGYFGWYEVIVCWFYVCLVYCWELGGGWCQFFFQCDFVWVSVVFQQCGYGGGLVGYGYGVLCFGYCYLLQFFCFGEGGGGEFGFYWWCCVECVG